MAARFIANIVVVPAITLLTSLPAQAEAVALLNHIEGTVLVDVGEGFVPVAQEARLDVGDRVMVTKDGAAVLSYGQDCSFPLQAPSMTSIEPTECAISTQGTGGGGGVMAGGLLSVGTTVGASAISMSP